MSVLLEALILGISRLKVFIGPVLWGLAQVTCYIGWGIQAIRNLIPHLRSLV